MALISANWPLRIVCCAALLLWMPEQSAGAGGSGNTASLRTAVVYNQGSLAPDK